GDLGKVKIEAGTKMTLRFCDGLIHGDVDEGKAVADVPDGVEVSMDTDTPTNLAPGSPHQPYKVIATRNPPAAPTVSGGPGAQGGISQLTGQLIVNGSVTVNGNRAITGTTIFTGSNIVVDRGKGNSAIVNLGKLGRVEIDPGTIFTL